MSDDLKDMLKNSVCVDCIYMVSRLLRPVEPMEFGFDPEEIEEAYEEGEELIVEQNTCAILNMDLMYEVLHCNRYIKEGPNRSIFSGPNAPFT